MEFLMNDYVLASAAGALTWAGVTFLADKQMVMQYSPLDHDETAILAGVVAFGTVLGVRVALKPAEFIPSGSLGTTFDDSASAAANIVTSMKDVNDILPANAF